MVLSSPIYSINFFRSCIVDEGNMEVLLRTEDLPFQDSLIQCIRISPDHKYMAAGIKRADSEECACIVVKLDALPTVESIIPNVFNFGKRLASALFALWCNVYQMKANRCFIVP